MPSDGVGIVHFADRFENSKVRKRFLSQMIPMCRLLRRHGLLADVAETMVYICKPDEGRELFVSIEKGERRFMNSEMIFIVGDMRESFLVAANQIRGVLRTLVRCGVLVDGEIPEEEIDLTVKEARIQCAGCLLPQEMFEKRLAQCRTCKDRDKMAALPEFKGFYCSRSCQVSDWTRHRTEDH